MVRGISAILGVMVWLGTMFQISHAQSFQDVIQLALINDPRIGAAIAAAEAEGARVDQSRSSGGFQISTAFNIEGDESSSDLNEQVAKVELSRQLLSFGRLATSVAAAEARVGLAWIEVARTSQDVFADTSIAYANVLEADEQYYIRQQFVQELDAQFSSIEARIDVGLAGITELQALTRRMAEAEVAALLAEQETITTRIELERLGGTNIEAVEPWDLLSYLKFVPTSLGETLRLAELNSPESQISAQRFLIIEAEVMAQSRASTPSLELYGNYEYGERNGADLADADFGLRFSAPLYQGGLRDATAREGSLNEQEALRLRQQDQMQIRQFASIAWTGLDIAQRTQQVWAQVLTIQEQRVDAVQNEVDADLAAVDILLDARAELVDTRSDFVRSRYDVIRAQLNLIRTAGLSSPASDI